MGAYNVYSCDEPKPELAGYTEDDYPIIWHGCWTDKAAAESVADVLRCKYMSAWVEYEEPYRSLVE